MYFYRIGYGTAETDTINVLVSDILYTEDELDKLVTCVVIEKYVDYLVEYAERYDNTIETYYGSPCFVDIFGSVLKELVEKHDFKELEYQADSYHNGWSYGLRSDKRRDPNGFNNPTHVQKEVERRCRELGIKFSFLDGDSDAK